MIAAALPQDLANNKSRLRLYVSPLCVSYLAILLGRWDETRGDNRYTCPRPKQQQKFMMLHMDRSNAIDIVNTAEAETGQKVAREEEK